MILKFSSITTEKLKIQGWAYLQGRVKLVAVMACSMSRDHHRRVVWMETEREDSLGQGTGLTRRWLRNRAWLKTDKTWQLCTVLLRKHLTTLPPDLQTTLKTSLISCGNRDYYGFYLYSLWFVNWTELVFKRQQNLKFMNNGCSENPTLLGFKLSK